MNSKIVPAKIYFETEDKNTIIIEYYPGLEEKKRIVLTKEQWEKLENKEQCENKKECHDEVFNPIYREMMDEGLV